MCTATWRTAADGYAICFNRDEARTRATELAARRIRRGGVECVAPFDAGGGTWIGVNELGFTACLLNAYPEPHDPARVESRTALRAPRALSRGFLVLGVLDSADVEAARQRIQEGDLRWFQPFRLLAFAPGETPLGLAWDGVRLVEEPLSHDAGMVCSSGWSDRRARRARQAAWDHRFGGRSSRVPEEGELIDFHRSHAPSLPAGPLAEPVDLAAGAESVCMHRPDARTVSFVRVRVGAGSVALSHQPGSPCRHAANAPAKEIALPHRAAGRGSVASPAASLAGGPAEPAERPAGP